ncbi:N-acetylglucosamine-specific PTS transporter subunit IIBC [Thermoanaerobacterium thermosaccharolyticum]|uniref:PTS system N-acetylglucosamine-specific IICB component, Glc family n=1 Tax=Thermoanaerobacterium thermosaccharolyticum M0795 TaxID=698948 RepID=L0INU1_THETR|nr:N-acetylglucosamine-specific PTS transporter subunit IIBC [Thermoanaerobacterium thermosaccharolyticum]AGB19881.1 PTS system N-acetylglucosamine-specific IICB component, Glc family [Thermoanaerobacterium thermosaccharolyticum M0795]
MKGLGNLQKLGKALMLPIAVLPAAALLLRLGAKDVFNIPFITNAGGAIFDNLPLIFAIGIAIGFAGGDGVAGLAATVGYLVLTKGATTINKDINMGVLGGILIGVIAGYLYNRYHDVKLPDFLGFFGGKRFVPIITSLAALILAFAAGYVWPPIQNVIYALGKWIISAGAFGVFIYGVLNRLLIPVGLHHVINSLVWFVFGSFKSASGAIVTGDLNRFYAGDPTAGRFMTGFYPIMMFALPAAALAMVMAAKPKNRKAVSGIMISAALTAFLTGITEPIEFAFMFLAPVLYVVHAILTGLSLAITYILGIRMGFGFSAGLIDYILSFGISSKPILLFLIGIIYAVVYFLVFYFLIVKLNLPTPGRLDEDTNDSAEKLSNSDIGQMAQNYLEILGGAGNIVSLESCITRLRLSVKDDSVINDDELKKAGANGVIRMGNGALQVIVGTKADLIAQEMQKRMKKK